MNSEIVERIKTAFERNGRAIELRPAVGQNTDITKTRVIDGLHVATEEGRWKLVSDGSEKAGGTAGAHAEYLESIVAFRRGAGYAVPGEFVVTRGRRA